MCLIVVCCLFFVCPTYCSMPVLHRYIYKLADLHKEQNSYVEAAYTLLLHAELLQVSMTALLE